MRIAPQNSIREPGSALVIVLVLLGVMAALVVGNMTNLRRLGVELKLLERHQIQRLQTRPQPPQAVIPADAPSKPTE